MLLPIWLTSVGVSAMALNLKGFNFNQSVIDSQGRVINTWAEIVNRDDLGVEVTHELNAHNFQLDLASGDSLPVHKVISNISFSHVSYFWWNLKCVTFC